MTLGVRWPALVAASWLLVAWQAWAQPLLVQPSTGRVSTAADGTQGNARSVVTSHNGAVSADGRVLVFVSLASNLVPGDTNGQPDVFLRDTRATTPLVSRVSVLTGGGQANGPSSDAVISANGRFVAFTSRASNLVDGDTNNVCDINGDTIFDENCDDVFVRDLAAGTTARVSVGAENVQANLPSYLGMISSSGRYVVFFSYATNLVANLGGYTPNCANVFLRDRQIGTTALVSRSSQGQPGNGTSWLPTFSGDERQIAYASSASNLVTADANGQEDVFVFDRLTLQTTLVSVGAGSTQGNGPSTQPAVSWDGRYVAFESAATNLVAVDLNAKIDVFLRDRRSAVTSLVSVSDSGIQGNRDSGYVSISADARWVAFQSSATTLAAGSNGVTQIWVRDVLAGKIHRVSVNTGGTQGELASSAPAISSDGRCLAYSSLAATLVSSDTNGVSDVFLTDTRPWVNSNLLQFKPDRHAGLLFHDMARGGFAYTGSTSDGSTYTYAPVATPWSPGWTVWKQDINEDGLSDLFLYNKATGLWYDAVNGAGLYGPSNDFIYFGGRWSPGWDVTVLDLNGDGRSDVFVYDPQTGVWYKCIRQRPGEFTYFQGTWTQGKQLQLYPASLNGDTLMDLFLYRPSTGEWYWALSAPEATFSYVAGLWSPDWHVTIGAFDDDGNDDVFVYNRANGYWYLCFNNGAGFNYKPGQWSPGWDVHATYLDPDDRTDLFVYNPANGSYYDCITNNLSYPNIGFDYSPGQWGPGWQVYFSDFNGDGSVDALNYDPVSGRWFRRTWLGPGQYDPATGESWSPGWSILTRGGR